MLGDNYMRRQCFGGREVRRVSSGFPRALVSESDPFLSPPTYLVKSYPPW